MEKHKASGWSCGGRTDGPAPQLQLQLQPSTESSCKDKTLASVLRSAPLTFLSGFHHHFPLTINKLRITEAGRIPGVWMHLSNPGAEAYLSRNPSDPPQFSGPSRSFPPPPHALAHVLWVMKTHLNSPLLIAAAGCSSTMTPNELSHPSEGVPAHFKYLLTYICTEGCVYSEVPSEVLQKLPSLAGNLSPHPRLLRSAPEGAAAGRRFSGVAPSFCRENDTRRRGDKWRRPAGVRLPRFTSGAPPATQHTSAEGTGLKMGEIHTLAQRRRTPSKCLNSVPERVVDT